MNTIFVLLTPIFHPLLYVACGGCRPRLLQVRSQAVSASAVAAVVPPACLHHLTQPSFCVTLQPPSRGRRVHDQRYRPGGFRRGFPLVSCADTAAAGAQIGKRRQRGSGGGGDARAACRARKSGATYGHGRCVCERHKHLDFLPHGQCSQADCRTPFPLQLQSPCGFSTTDAPWEMCTHALKWLPFMAPTVSQCSRPVQPRLRSLRRQPQFNVDILTVACCA